MKNTILLLCLFLAGCVNRPLDPTGPYAGDAFLWSVDNTIVQIDDTLTMVDEFVVRNPLVAERSDVKKVLHRLDKLDDGVVDRRVDGTIDDHEVLALIIVARDAYAAARTPENAAALKDKLALADLLLKQVRVILPLFAAPPPLLAPEPVVTEPEPAS